MNLTQAFEQTLKNHALCAPYKRLAKLIDLTQLEDKLDEHALDLLCSKAYIYDVAAICVYPQYLSSLRSRGDFTLASVLNFPSGQEAHSNNMAALEALISEGNLDELDYVFPYSLYLSGEQKTALNQTREIAAHCHKANITCKVILETGALADMDTIYQISRAVLDTGCDFIKSSTGKIASGATPEAAFAMLHAIVDHGNTAGIKLSGGIHTKEQALLYVNLALFICNRAIDRNWFRIGASRLINTL